MFRWVKLFGNQYLGFWILGLVFFALQEIPYMVMPLFQLKNNPIMTMEESLFALDILEKVLGSLCIAVMVFIVNKNSVLFSTGTGLSRLGFVMAMIVLLFNFVGWGIYFSGNQSVMIIMLFLVVLPPMYYIFIGLWRENWTLLVIGLLFEIMHVVHIYGNLRLD